VSFDIVKVGFERHARGEREGYDAGTAVPDRITNYLRGEQ